MVSKDTIERIFREKIVEIAPNVKSLDEISAGSSLNADYGMDSINSITMLLELEEALGIYFDDNDFEDIDFFSYDHVLQKIVEKAEASNE